MLELERLKGLNPIVPVWNGCISGVLALQKFVLSLFEIINSLFSFLFLLLDLLHHYSDEKDYF